MPYIRATNVLDLERSRGLALGVMGKGANTFSIIMLNTVIEQSVN